MWRAIACGLAVAVAGTVRAEEPAANPDRVRAAVERGLAIVQQAARNYPDHRKCFSCHHQTLPMLAMSEARAAGVAVDEDLFDAQLAFTRRSLESRRQRLEKGQRIGGRSATVTYAAWTLGIAEAEPDPLARAFASYLLQHQRENGAWHHDSRRPPLIKSDFTLTTLAVYALQQYADADRQDESDKAIARAAKFLRETETKTHEDAVARLWGLHLLGAKPSEEPFRAARQAVLATQQEDGGWGQKPGMAGDAYATGQAIWILRETGTPAGHAALHRAADFLVSTQEDDGSWHVQTRAVPVQVFFDNGDPHGKDQFISIAATAWATAGLARMLPDGETPAGPER